jgi:hypothetical protein
MSCKITKKCTICDRLSHFFSPPVCLRLSVWAAGEGATDSVNPRDYIKKMLRRDPELKSKWGTICPPVEMLAPDGKRRKTQAYVTKRWHVKTLVCMR